MSSPPKPHQTISHMHQIERKQSTIKMNQTPRIMIEIQVSPYQVLSYCLDCHIHRDPNPSSTLVPNHQKCQSRLPFPLNSEVLSNPWSMPMTNDKQQMVLYLHQMIQYSTPLMVGCHDNGSTGVTWPTILGVFIGASIILVLGLIVAVIQVCPRIRDQVIVVWNHVMSHLWWTSGENPWESMHLPIQTPPPPSPQPPSPIPIPAQHLVHTFDTFDTFRDQQPICICDIMWISKQIGQQGGGWLRLSQGW